MRKNSLFPVADGWIAIISRHVSRHGTGHEERQEAEEEGGDHLGLMSAERTQKNHWSFIFVNT